LSEHRQRNLGVKRYTWRTNVDGRERPHHRERNGKAFSWDEPPSGGHPGSEVHCRCTAEAILDLDDLFGAEDVTLTDATGAVVNAGDSEEEAPQVQRAARRAP